MVLCPPPHQLAPRADTSTKGGVVQKEPIPVGPFAHPFPPKGAAGRSGGATPWAVERTSPS